MSLSLFDLVGPVMMGPSSSHTAGAVRIGYLARQIMGQEPRKITLYFHPVLMQTYAGHRTHAALVAGLLGFREADAAGVLALQEAKEKGIDLEIKQVSSATVHQNTMRISAETHEDKVVVNGISVGGGSIRISEIDGLEVNLDGNAYSLLVRAKKDAASEVAPVLEPCQIMEEFKNDHLSCWTLRQEVPADILRRIQDIPGIANVQLIAPLYPFRDSQAHPPLFTTVAEYLAAAEELGFPEAALQYETRRTGKSPAAVRGAFAEILAIMEEATLKGLEGDSQLIGGFCTGNDGWRLMQAYREGKSLTGGIFVPAMARGLSVMEVNGAMGRVVAAPTAGSAGVLPGVLFSVGEQLQKDKAELIRALMVAAAIGVCIANKASLSGAVGGCQGEVGVAAAMAAAGACYLGGGDGTACAHAGALTLKNILGLICDPPAGPVEVPCIKRNAMGVAVALMGAELALAGIRSFIPPDEVIDALVNTQQYLPQELKGSTIGGLACTRTGAFMRANWQQKLKDLE